MNHNDSLEAFRLRHPNQEHLQLIINNRDSEIYTATEGIVAASRLRGLPQADGPVTPASVDDARYVSPHSLEQPTYPNSVSSTDVADFEAYEARRQVEGAFDDQKAA